MHHPTKGKCARRGCFLCPTTDGSFSLHCHFLAVGVCPVSFRRFASWLSFFVPPRSTGFLLMLLLGPSLSFFALLLDLFSSSVLSFPPCSVAGNRWCLARRKTAFAPPPRVRASCARASRVSNNCLHLFTQCAQLLDMECFVVKANCRVFRFTFLPDGCKALSFSEIR